MILFGGNIISFRLKLASNVIHNLRVIVPSRKLLLVIFHIAKKKEYKMTVVFIAERVLVVAEHDDYKSLGGETPSRGLSRRQNFLRTILSSLVSLGEKCHCE